MKGAYLMSMAQAAQTFANGAILVEDYDSVIFDRVLREYPLWGFISKRVAPGDFTATMQQTAVGAARAANKRSLAYTSTGPTRSLDTQQEIKAIVHDITFGMYDRSVYNVQGHRFGNLTQKDLADSKTACLREWQRQVHLGDDDGDPLEFNGWRDQLGAAADTINADVSIVKSIRLHAVQMTNQTDYDVRLNAIVCNAMVRQMIVQELTKAGDKLVKVAVPGPNNQVSEELAFLDTAAGPLRLIVDPWNTAVAGTPNVYPTLLTHSDNMNWQYIPPLGVNQADPATFNIAMTNVLDEQNKTVMFGALQMLGGTAHNRRLDIQERTTVVDPTV